jgi:RNA polymerase sigma-70 factor (ECF subfamily)
MHLFYFEDLPIARIAELLDLELGAVKMRLSRGRELMRGQLQGAYFND